jgi:hypothetical protein
MSLSCSMMVQLLLDMGVIYWCRRISGPDISFSVGIDNFC